MTKNDFTLQHVEANREALLAGLDARGAVLRDMVRGVAGRYAPGFYLYGPPGTGKTHTVRGVLDQALNGDYVYRRGHLTPVGLFELLAEASDAVIVLDDVGEIFTHRVAVQILLAALERPKGGRERRITYKRKGGESGFNFRGGLVAISNLSLHDAGTLGALRSRVNTLKYDPPQDQLAALVLAIADGGPPGAGEVARHVVAELLRVGGRIDVRLFADKALPIYAQARDGDAECDWRDLVTAVIQEGTDEPRHGVEAPASRAARIEAETRLAVEIYEALPDPKARVAAWEEKTKKSARAFYRRLEGARDA